jgi:hypothetical protein
MTAFSMDSHNAATLMTQVQVPAVGSGTRQVIRGIARLVRGARQALGSNRQETLWETLMAIDDAEDQFERRIQFIETFALWWRSSMAYKAAWQRFVHSMHSCGASSTLGYSQKSLTSPRRSRNGSKNEKEAVYW